MGALELLMTIAGIPFYAFQTLYKTATSDGSFSKTPSLAPEYVYTYVP